ncbi:unnamed protein product [Meganyctiphanes norvegica]|uniref:SGNH hydrolase-type esterase domain-containing protein n=1 Tax=Meganyctiphanes norvegica TaxID=48144 RepID=A0AAV2SGT9_MEGNR
MAHAVVPRKQFIVKLNDFEYQLLHQALTDGFLLVWMGDSHARIICQRNHLSPGNFPVAPTIKFVGRGGRNISTFERHHFQEASEVHPHSALQRIGILFLGSNDIDVHSWPAGRPLNSPANELLRLRENLLNHYDHVFIIGLPERDFCRGRNPDLVHRLSLRCNQRLNDVIKGFYIKLPNAAFNWTDGSRFTPDGVHHSNALYDFILLYVQQKLRGIMTGDEEYVSIV